MLCLDKHLRERKKKRERKTRGETSWELCMWIEEGPWSTDEEREYGEAEEEQGRGGSGEGAGGEGARSRRRGESKQCPGRRGGRLEPGTGG